jgi:hypothetical protein
VTTTSPPDDPTILGHDRLFRRIFHARDNQWVRLVVTDSKTQVRQPTSAGFSPEDDGMSVYLESTLHHSRLGPAAVVTDPMNAVAALRAEAIRAQGLGIVRAPNPADVPDPDHPRHAAHCLAKGWDKCKTRNEQRKLRKALAIASELVIDPGATF